MQLTWNRIITVGVLTGMLGGCALSTGSESPSGNSGAGGAGGGTSGTGGTFGGVGGGGGGAAGGSTSGASSTSGVGGGSGKLCGGFPGTECGPSEFCDYPDDLCGGADGQGVCTTRPNACPDFYKPACACDGMVYGNPCEANSLGHDVSTLASCEPPTKDLFQCGSGFCDVKTQYCQRTLADVPNTPDSNVCAPLPAGCSSPPSCACIPDPCGAPIPGTCEVTAGGGIRYTCPGG